MNKIIILVACMWLTSCANPSSKPVLDNGIDNNLPSFTSDYDAFSCDQLASEEKRITAQLDDISGVRDEDVVTERLEFVGGVLFWPVLLFLDGSSDSKAAQTEYDQLKDRLLSLTDWAEKKQCEAK